MRGHDKIHPAVVRVEFEVKVVGFAPPPVEDKRVYRGGDHRRKRMVAFNGGKRGK